MEHFSERRHYLNLKNNLNSIHRYLNNYMVEPAIEPATREK
jgi:hypothetical protein